MVLSVWLVLCHWRGISGPTYDSEAERAAGVFGMMVASHLIEFLGYLSWCVPFILFFWSVSLFRRSSYLRSTLWSMFALFLVPVLGGLGHFLQLGWIGGLLGGYVGDRLTVYFGIPVAPLLLLAALVVMMLLAIPNVFDPLGRLFSIRPRWRFPRVSVNLGWLFRRPGWLRWRRRASGVADDGPRISGRAIEEREDEEYEEDEDDEEEEGEEYEEEEFEEAEEEPEPILMQDPVAPAMVTRKKGTRKLAKARPSLSEGDGTYVHPTLAMLDPAVADEAAPGKDELIQRSNVLVEKLRNFGVETRVTEVHPGPVITRYELEPAPGVKVGQVVNLQNDLALAMKATSVRIVAPIPGKGTIGIEIPNDKPSVVYLSEVIASPKFTDHPSILKIALGKGISGDTVVTDLESMPHLLIAGSTGSGKSVCLNAIIACFLFTATPQDVSFVLIDPKMLELTPYNGIPHLKCPVITDAKTAVRALRWAVSEMENRYQLLARVGARDIGSYNEKVRELEAEGVEEPPRHLPYLVIIVDELADLMLSIPGEIESNIARLAQMARAVGIHMVLATQRPSVDVITGVIKANFPCRMAFRVPSKTDSRTILDQNGAETLLGKGDMLFLAAGKRDVMRVHGCFLSLGEAERLVEHVKVQTMAPAEPFVDFAKTDARTGSRGKDELFDEAARLVVKHQQGSVSLLQRRLTVGYARAARLIDMLEEAGIVGPFEGSKAREVLVSSEDFFAKGP
jgi:S-DNA-T family DNA segregation ATPase FtsK/SpoIIIE